MRKVAVIQREIPHYRIRFFEELCLQGMLQDLDVHVYCGIPPAQRSSSGFPCHVLPVRYFGKKKSSSFWLQGLGKAIAGSEIVVAPQELQCLTVPYLWARQKQICKTWVWWGHGYNFQSAVRPSIVTSVKECVKGFMTRRAAGLITYTERGAEHWRKRGVPESRVIPYYNTLDVDGLRKARAEVSEPHRIELRRKLMLEEKRVLLFSGRLYAGKKVDFLLRAFAMLKRSRQDVALLIIGDGEERNGLQQLATDLALQDVHFLGEIVTPKDTATYFSLAELMVIPSLVGLVVVHGFALGLPLITTSAPGHGPEIEYLSNENGEIADCSERAFAQSIGDVLGHPWRLEQMRTAARIQADKLRIEHSVSVFLKATQMFAAV